MTEREDTGGNPLASPSDLEDSINLLDLALVLAARKRFILSLSFAVAVITAIVVLIMPVTYTATTTMLPPQQQESTAMAMLSQIGGLALAGWGWWRQRPGVEESRRSLHRATAKRAGDGWNHPPF